MKKEIVKTADAILDRGHRVLLIPVKDGTKIFEVDQKRSRYQSKNRILTGPYKRLRLTTGRGYSSRNG